MGQQIEELAKFVADRQWQDLPERVQSQAKLVLLDTFGVILAGSVRPEVEKLRERFASTARGAAAPQANGSAGTGATVYAKGFATTDPRSAALLNGIAARAIELCEGMRLISGQAGIQVLPGILALAEHDDASGRDLLTALALGYDVAGRVGHAFKPRPLAHQNGQASLLAAAAAGAKLSRMSADEISAAMRISTTLVLTPSYTNAVAGATALNVAGGMSGFVGALARDLVRAGFVAQPDAIEEALANLVGDGFDASRVTEDMGTRWHITENYFRLYASCNPIHPALDALSALLGRVKPRPEDIERIDVATYRFASVMKNPDPPNFFASKYSLPHVAAVMIVKGRAGHTAVNDEAVNDPAITALRHRVHVTEDAAMSAVAPKLRPARVTLTLKDGRVETYEGESHRGDFTQPFEESELLEKFRELAEHVLPDDKVQRIEELLRHAEEWKSVRELSAALRD